LSAPAALIVIVFEPLIAGLVPLPSSTNAIRWPAWKALAAGSVHERAAVSGVVNAIIALPEAVREPQFASATAVRPASDMVPVPVIGLGENASPALPAVRETEPPATVAVTSRLLESYPRFLLLAMVPDGTEAGSPMAQS